MVTDRDEPLSAVVLAPRSPERIRCEQALAAQGVPVPFMHRSEWMAARPGTTTRFVGVSEGGVWRYGVGIQVAWSRALPAHLLLRVERLDPAVDPPACRAVLRSIAALARARWPRVLRVYVELFSVDPAAREAAGRQLATLGFRRSERTRMYRNTVIVDLAAPEDVVFARLHRSARRNVRLPQRTGLEVRQVADVGFAPRIDALIRESFARTGGHYSPEDWSSILTVSAQSPTLSRVSGLFRTDIDGPDALLAFEWSCMNGDHVQSIAAGSTKQPPAKGPLAYCLVWDIMRWGRECGARYMDLGGVAAEAGGASGPLSGITEFKRSFGGTEVEVGEEWFLEPRPASAVIAAGLANAASIVRRFSARLGRHRRSTSRNALLDASSPATFEHQEG